MKNNNKKAVKIFLLILAIVLVLGGTSYAFYNILIEGRKQHQILTDGLIFSYTDTSEGISMNLTPMDDEEGIINGGEFTFEVSAELKADDLVYYMVYIAPTASSTVDNKYAKMALFDVNDNLLQEPIAVSELEQYKEENNAYVLYTDKFELTKNVKQTRKYKLKFWISNNLVDTNVSYKDEDSSHIAIAGEAEYSFNVGVATGRLGKPLSTLILNQGVAGSGNGLLMSTDTNDGTPTYYYRGSNVDNYVQLGSKAGGSCEYNGNLLIDFTSMSYASKKACLETTGICDASAVGYPFLVGVTPEMCASVGTYIEDTPVWNEKVCNYNSQTIVKYTGDGTNLQAAPVLEDECSSIKTLCDARSEGLGLITNIPDDMCTDGMTLITLDETPSFSKVNTPMLWRVVRINEDETIRLVSTSVIVQPFNLNSNTYEDTYYSNTNIENGMMWALNNWYNENLSKYDSQIATSTFCEQAKVSSTSNVTFGNVAMMGINDGYAPTFKCEEDANGHGLVTGQKIGLLSLDEALYSGCEIGEGNTYIMQTMTTSPENTAYIWTPNQYNLIDAHIESVDYQSTPVISLKSDVYATGLGTFDSPWKIQK